MHRKKLAAVIFFSCLLSGLLFFHYGFSAPLPADRQELYRQVISRSAVSRFPQFPLLNKIDNQSCPEFIPLTASRLKAAKNIIIILGSKPLDMQTPTIDSVYRVVAGIKLLRSLPDSLIVFSGGFTLDGISEAEMMGVIAWSRGVGTIDMALEQNSLTTKENARYCADLLTGNCAERIILVSRKNHLKRAIADFSGFQVFKSIEGQDCGVSRRELLAQLEAYLSGHSSAELKRRIVRLRQGEEF